jgi:hypothetical protein
MVHDSLRVKYLLIYKNILREKGLSTQSIADRMIYVLAAFFCGGPFSRTEEYFGAQEVGIFFNE